MAKYVMFASVKDLPGFITLIERGLVDIDKKTLLIKKQGTFVKLPLEKIDEFKEYVAKFATPAPVVETPVSTPVPVVEDVLGCPKHFTPNNVNFNETPMSQMKYGCKVGTTVGIVLANSNGNGFYLHTVAGVNNILYREDNLSVKDRESVVKLLTYSNKHFLTVEQYIKAIDTLKSIYTNGSTELCKRIIKTLWVNVNL